MNSYTSRLASLLSAMKRKGIDIYLITSSDPHLGENIPDHWRITEWLTGFTGSSSTVIVSDSFAGLWTDSRYFIQAREQLRGSGFQFMKPELNERNDFTAWLAGNVRQNATLGTDGRKISILKWRQIESSLEGKDVKFMTDIDLVSEIWSERPAMPFSTAFDFPVSLAGKDRNTKIAEIRKQMDGMKLGYHLLTSPDDIMWLLNIRGRDLKYSPLIFSFAIISHEQVLLFTDELKIPFGMAAEFDRSGIVILPYEDTGAVLASLPADSSILISPGATSVSLFRSVPARMQISEGYSIPGRLKAVKNSVETEHIGKAMVKDGVALTRFFFWLEGNAGSANLTECSIAEKLTAFRAEQEGFLGESFQPIVAYNGHGALPHYSPSSETDSVIAAGGILLIDSGGQYMEGTTDITRTITLGRPGPDQKRDFTLVLKGHIALASVKMPAGTRGIQLDILARRPLWEQGINYGHGTGHGVGYCLNVHEGPVSISPGNSSETRTMVEAGMLVSNEPAIYREDEYGIRTENLILCYEDEETEFGQFLRFETVSLCYIDKSLTDVSLLSREEISWLNKYHESVYDRLSPYLNYDEKEWLREKTSPV